MNWRVIFLITLTAFTITLAIMIGQRLSSEALSILLGVVIGVAASLPSSLIMVWALKRTQPPPASSEPRIVIVPPPATPQPFLPPAPNLWNTPRPDSPKRQFIVIGGDEPTDE